MTFLITMACIMAYFMVGGMAYSRIQITGKERCRYSGHDLDCGHTWLAGISVAAWPITLPIFAGIFLGERESKDERRRQRELAEARHTRELERELGIR